MERNKSQDKQIDILLSALQEEAAVIQEIESLEIDFDIVDFLNAFNISEGDNRLEIGVLYFYYKKWSDFPVKYSKFRGIIKRFLSIYRASGKSYVHIKNDFVNLNNEIVRTKRSKTHLKRALSFKKHILLFIEEMSIVESDEWVKDDLVYKWYKSWRYKRKNIKLTRAQLRNILKFYFQAKVGKTNGFFKLKGEFNMEKIRQLRGTQDEEETNKKVKV